MPSAPQVISRSTSVAAPPERVWALVSDLPGMGAFSPEATGGTWSGGASGPAVGAGFRGRNSSGRRRWSTRSTVTRCVPGGEFAFEVKAAGLRVAEWAYDVQPDGAGCRLTESWTDRRSPLMVLLGRLTTGVVDREGFTARSIEQTLSRVKTRAEQQDEAPVRRSP